MDKYTINRTEVTRFRRGQGRGVGGAIPEKIPAQQKKKIVQGASDLRGKGVGGVKIESVLCANQVLCLTSKNCCTSYAQS